MTRYLTAVLCAALAACGGGGDGGNASGNDPALIGSWGYRTDNLAYDAAGCGGSSLSAAAERVKIVFDGNNITFTKETCYAGPTGNEFRVASTGAGTYITGNVFYTYSASSSGAVQSEIKLKKIDTYNNATGTTNYGGYYINSAGNLVVAAAANANDGSTPEKRQSDIENAPVLVKLK